MLCSGQRFYHRNVFLRHGRPLKGLEGKISRIDRHKRLAWLTVELFGRTVELQAGLEIVRKE